MINAQDHFQAPNPISHRVLIKITTISCIVAPLEMIYKKVFQVFEQSL